MTALSGTGKAAATPMQTPSGLSQDATLALTEIYAEFNYTFEALNRTTGSCL